MLLMWLNKISSKKGRVRDNPNIKILECDECGLVFLERQITNNLYYAEGNMRKTFDTFVRSQLGRASKLPDTKRRINYIKQIMELSNANLLDFGSGYGDFLIAAKANNANYVAGIEIESQVKPIYKNHQIDLFESIDEIRNHTYDIISIFHCIAHIHDCITLLKSLAHKLKDNGKILIETPNANDALLSIFDCESFANFTYQECMLYYFNPYTLKKIGEQAGFNVEFVKGVQRYPLSNTLYWLSKGKPAGQQYYWHLDDTLLQANYESKLAQLGATDTLLMQLSKKEGGGGQNALVCYGKEFDNSKILRTPQWIKEQVAKCTSKANKFLKQPRKILKACPMCNGTSLKPYVEIYGFHYVECENCENLFIKDPLKNIAQLYQNDGTESSFDDAYYSNNFFPIRLEVISKPKANFINKTYQNTNKIARNPLWLDIGCGAGELLYAARELGFDILGFESDTKAVHFANNKLGNNIVQEGFLDINSCDLNLLKSIQDAQIISFLNVLEHLESPKETLEFFGKEMKKDSLLVIEVPRHPSLASFVNLVAPNQVYRHLIAPLHLNIFSEKSLESVYTKAGFKLVGKWVYGQGFMDIIHAFTGFDRQKNLYKQINQISNEVQKVIDKNNLGDFLLLVLQKIKGKK